MSFWGKAKCTVGIHDWSEWAYSKSKMCDQTRTCKRCKKVANRVNHTWGEFLYTADKSCDQARTCGRCGEVEQGEAAHQWGPWSYVSDHNCDIKRKCNRCGKGQKDVDHVWGPWEYEAPRSCNQVRICKRCNTAKQFKAAEQNDHDWSDEYRHDCLELRRACERCAKVSSRIGTFHRFGPWVSNPGEWRKRKCADCGLVETGP